MPEWLSFFAKGIIIAALAAITASGYVYALFFFGSGPDGAISTELLLTVFGVALVGTYSIGLPIAFFTYRFSAQHMAKSVETLAMVAVLSGIMLIIASFVVGDRLGVMYLGIPAFIAAITFAVLGWFWILRPMRARD